MDNHYTQAERDLRDAITLLRALGVSVAEEDGALRLNAAFHGALVGMKSPAYEAYRRLTEERGIL